MQVDLLLNCGHIIIVPIESVLKIPKVGLVIVCATCKNKSSVMGVGLPYRVAREDIPPEKEQKSLLGDT